MSEPAAVCVSGYLEPGTVLGEKYRIERLIGEGGMGVVYQGYHEVLEQRIAIKVVRPELVHHPEALARFLNEARAIARLRGHHIAHVLDTGCLADQRPHMVLEYLEGADLRAVLDAEGSLSLARALNYLLQACEAVAEAHALGLIHRDLKPENLFITRGAHGEGVVKVIDFGISKRIGAAVGRSYTLRGQSLGSPHYMAPEQMASPDTVDARADIWSLGVVLFEALTNAVPFGGDTLPQVCASILAGEQRDVRLFRPDLPPVVEHVIRRCLRREREERYQNVAELAAALLPLASQAGATAGLSVQGNIDDVEPRSRTLPRAWARQTTLRCRGEASQSGTWPIALRRKPRRWPIALGALAALATLALGVQRSDLLRQHGALSASAAARATSPTVRAAMPASDASESGAANQRPVVVRVEPVPAATAAAVAPAPSVRWRGGASNSARAQVSARSAAPRVRSPRPQPVRPPPPAPSRAASPDIRDSELLLPYSDLPGSSAAPRSPTPPAKRFAP